MTGLVGSVQHHQVLYTLAGYYIFSAAVGAMPTPMPNGNAFYSWMFHFLQTLGANLARVVANKYPQIVEPQKGTSNDVSSKVGPVSS
jgi:hypothetical protein